jgi:alpha-galactosidase
VDTGWQKILCPGKLCSKGPTVFIGLQCYQDLWTHTSNGTAVRNFTATAVPPHGVVALLLQDAGNEPEGVGPPCAVQDSCMDRNGTVVGE